MDKNTSSIIEPVKLLGKKNLLVARTVVDPDQSQTVMSIINMSDTPVRLQRNTLVGTVHTVQSVQKLETSTSHEYCNTKRLPEHLRPLVDNASEKLSQQQRKQLEHLLISYQDVFVGPDGKLGRTDLVKHEIDTGDSKPIKLPPRRTSYAQKQIIEQELDKMLAQDIIEPSNSPYAAPVLLVTKKDGSVRFCVDYRQLNSVTKKDAYPLPRIDTCLESLAGAKWFSTLDLASGYWQSAMHENSKFKTSFVTHKGTFEFKVLPFGLCNSPGTFERLMDIVLRGYHWERCLCYLDDVIVFGSTFDLALENLKAVFDRYRQANLKLKPSKCVLFQTEVAFLGHIVNEHGIKCDPQKVKKVQEWPVPTNVTELRQILGLVGYYRRFIPNCSSITAPLTKLLKKNVKFKWDKNCQESFETLKLKLTTSPVLSFPKHDEGQFILDTDSSLFAMGCVLSQVQQDEERVIAYSSKTLNRAQRNYCTTYRELLAVVTFIKEFRHFLWGRHFVVRTDHASLIWIKNFKEPEGILARWLTILDTYDYEIQYRKGSHHANADALSRLVHRRCKRSDCSDCVKIVGNKKNMKLSQPPVDNSHFTEMRNLVAPLSSADSPSAESTDNQSTESTDSQSTESTDNQSTESIDRHSTEGTDTHSTKSTDNQSTDTEMRPNWLDSWSPQQIKEWQQNDDCISKILELKAKYENKPPKNEILGYSNAVKTLWSLWESLEVHNDTLYNKWITDNTPQCYILQLVAPQHLKSIIFKELHSNHTAGHLGREKTLLSIRRRFYWPGMSSDIRRWCKQCSACAKSKPGPGLGKAPLTQFVVGAPLDVIALDIVGPLKETGNQNSFILVLGDYFTKWKEAYAIPDHTALTVADKIVTEFICRFGTPKQLHSDQGREFESHLFKHICQLLGIDKTHTAPYRPQSDGLVENFNKSLKQMLTSFVNENQDDWDDYLPFLLMAYRSAVHSSTGCTPNLLMLGRENNLPIDLMVGSPMESERHTCPVEYVEWVRKATEKCNNFVQKSLQNSALKQKKYYDRGLKPRSFNVGDFVWRWYPPKVAESLAAGWIGPYKILKKITSITYQIQRSPESKPIVVHVDHLKPFEGIQVPSVWSETDGGDNSYDLPSTPQPMHEANDDSYEGGSSGDDAEELPADDAYMSPQPEILRRSRWGRPIRRPCPYSPTL